jgi:hypothetical protein
MTGRIHPQQSFNSVLGLIRQGDKYGKERLERACVKALHIRSVSLKTVKAILSSSMDNIPTNQEESQKEEKLITHENIRGASYYN